MISKRLLTVGTTTVIASAVIAATAVLAQGAKTVIVDGSSTVYPVTEAVAEDFQKSQKGIRVTVGVSGTGGGFKKFCRGELDVTGASRPILAAEMAECKKNGINYIELPVAFDALTVVVNPQNTWATDLTVAELKKMWEPAAQGKIMNWNDIRPSFPNSKITLYGAGADSGTFDYFTEAINGKSKASRKDFTASEDDNVLVQGVSRDKNALGFFGYAYYAENRNKLKAVKVDGVEPNESTVLNGKYTPLGRPIFIYTHTKALDKPEVKTFVDYYMTNGAKLSKEVKYVPLPAYAYAAGKQKVTARRTGTVFGGKSEVGVTVAELTKRVPKN